MNPCISFIVPIFNASEYLNRCLESILKQTYRNIEVVLVDDGSTDSSLKICYEWRDKDSRIVVFHQENQGVSSARNKGIELASGDYITFVDADDWVDKNVCQKFIDALQRNDYDLFCYSAIYSNSKKSKKSFLFGSDIDLLSNQQREELLCKTMTPWAPWFEYNANTRFAGSSCGKFYKTHIFREQRFHFLLNTKISEDVLFNVLAFNNFKKIGYTRQSFYHYEMHDDSAQNRYRPNSWLDFSKVIELIQNWLRLTTRSQNIKDAANTLFVHYMFGTLKEDLFHKDNPNKKESLIRLDKILRNPNFQQILQKSNYVYFTFAEKGLLFLMKKKMTRIIALLMTVYVGLA